MGTILEMPIVFVPTLAGPKVWNTLLSSLRWLDIVFILCVCTPLLDFWGVKRILFLHVQLQNLDFVNLSAIFLSLFLQFPSVNFKKI